MECLIFQTFGVEPKFKTVPQLHIKQYSSYTNNSANTTSGKQSFKTYSSCKTLVMFCGSYHLKFSNATLESLAISFAIKAKKVKGLLKMQECRHLTKY